MARIKNTIADFAEDGLPLARHLGEFLGNLLADYCVYLQLLNISKMLSTAGVNVPFLFKPGLERGVVDPIGA